jgi:hypothetical protein
LFRSLVATAFLAGGFFPFARPVLAQTTAAGTEINNQATATYEDPNNPPDPNDPNDPRRINTTSNTVTITVAEVAGISVVAGTPVENNGNGVFEANDLVYFPFTVTNIGNDPTRFQIPTQAGINGPGTVGTLEYSTDNGTTWNPVPDGGFTTASIPVNGTIQVRVPVTINQGIQTGQQITVTLGETTPPNTNTNSPRNDVASRNDARDVFTRDNDNGTAPGEIDGTPANGVVEGSDSESITINTTSYSLATLLKTRNPFNDTTPGDIAGDTITYGLSLRVESTNNTGQALSPAPLAGSSITVDGNPGNYILVSDAIPTGTELVSATRPNSDWQIVYYTGNDLGTTDANQASWTTTQPPLNQVTRVGFVKRINGNTDFIPVGTTVTGFSIEVRVRTGQTAPLTIANIAQAFGTTPGTNFPVYEESGDQNPSNYDGQTPPVGTDTNGDGVPDALPPNAVDDGFIDTPNNPETGTDTNGDNTGQGPGGEANVLTLNAASVLNGPDGVPGAVGPTDNNDDFTNRSTPIPAGTTPGTLINPDVVTFQNTFRNTGTQPTNVSLLPTPPAIPGDLPNGTIVTISYNGTDRTYVWNGTVFQYQDPVEGLSNVNQPSDYITVPNVAVGANVTYSVQVDLPANTPLSTDINRGFPVPITAFVDDATPGFNNEAVRNITIDRVYTGFLKLVKFSAIEQGQGPAVGAGQEDFNSTPAVNGIDPDPNTADVPRTPGPGNIIVYQIRYQNISEPAAGNDNVILTAGNVVITENGTVLPNNWARDNDNNAVIDTSHVPNSATGTGTIEFFSGDPATTPATNATSGTTAASDVTRYVNNVGTVAPGPTPGTFIFRRRVN